MAASLTTEQLRQAASKLPRVKLAHLPTPLEEVKRFAGKLKGPRVFIKRDDCTGMVMGGNKTRHNEFLFGEALKQNADCLVWGPCSSARHACWRVDAAVRSQRAWPRFCRRRHPWMLLGSEPGTEDDRLR